MINYIKKSISKFKQDALSKLLYDWLKYLFGFLLLIISLRFIPWVNDKLLISLTVSVWQILMLMTVVMITGIIITIWFYKKRYNNLKTQFQTDELTGLKNHKALEKDLLNIQNNNSLFPISIILIDIDDFKAFNTKYGYEMADKILKKLGGLLKKDSRITDETYRYFMRGDEFVIITKETNIGNAQLAAERKRKLIEDTTFSVDNSELNLTVCCGVTEFNEGEMKEDLLKRANDALLKAKKNPGKNKTEIVY